MQIKLYMQDFFSTFVSPDTCVRRLLWLMDINVRVPSAPDNRSANLWALGASERENGSAFFSLTRGGLHVDGEKMHTLSTRGCTFWYHWAWEECPTHTHNTLDMKENALLVAIYICVMRNARLYVPIVNAIIWACQDASDTRSKTTEKHEKCHNTMKKANIYRLSAVKKFHCWHPSRAQCVFSGHFLEIFV